MKNLLKTSLALFILTTTFFSCNGDGGDPPSVTNSYYVEADITIEDQETFHFKNAGIGSATSIKAEVGDIGQLVLYGNDQVNDRQISITYKYYDPTDPTTNLAQIYIFKMPDSSETIGYATMSIIQLPEDCYGNFNITNETESYLEGTFSFKGVRIDQTGHFGIKAEITNGKFKIKKTY